MNFQEWFDEYLARKQFPYRKFKCNGTGQISIYELIDVIKSCSEEEQNKIREMILIIELSKGDILRFFSDLADGLNH
ncbi:hypothetical protein [Aneurinibacillus aneurinilyticus]|jgi:Ca2+-binding EF-hand superfamily protein|uniref:hypothetical protein n=1 Tax=Aneurinibacillus aneurinilyticus TaxID=1391 RepID=UPI0023F7C158|nr:hypothetical protein [Aneurinibacillus aneurinilyticus]MCI1693294.1 hypothetical protein [Aneurinibacillus aneurinilyticus]